MAFESITDDKIADLLNCPKRIENPSARTKIIDQIEKMNYKVISTDGAGHKFIVYKRQNLRPNMEDDFSCGICWTSSTGELLTLKRYNGPNHIHKNYIEKLDLERKCHIHFASEKYIRANRKAEGFADITDRYTKLEGAFDCLVKDCKISNIGTTPEILNQISLF